MTTSPTTPVDLEALAGLLDAAVTELHAAASLPWRADEDDNPEWDVPILDAANDYICNSPDDGVRGGFESVDARLIVAAVNALPALLDELREARAALGRVEALLGAEVAGLIEDRVRSARADVRCLDCGLRYAEREDYGCGEDGRGHGDGYDSELVAAEYDARAESVEYVTVNVADFRTALTPKEPDEQEGTA